ncbi:acyl-CoA dehydrogenase [Gammaproteobacteria bacterium 45_16_T64]|nr:acyl-CoA dehydrogenase [Gammaproteobacteria bacterium 45_16_T64]
MHFSHSAKTQELIARVQTFIDEHITPNEALYFEQLNREESDWKKWQVPPIMETLKAKAKEEGLWNLFLPNDEFGAGLTNLEYASLAELMGHSIIASEVFNCSAPDTGNMEVLEKYGTEKQQKEWLLPLLNGEIRSAFCMTEPGVASSDATNMEATAEIDGDEIVINGRKWWSSGIGHPNCEVLVFMGLTDPTAHRHAQHSMVLIPMKTKGVEVQRMLPVFGELDAPFGHGEVVFDNVRVPLENMIAGAGRGFEVAQGRLGPGRIHHCMRAIGAAEEALKLMIERSTSRVSFGKPIVNLGGNRDKIADARIAIEQARLLTLKAAYLMDTVGVLGAMSEISQIKVVAPNMAAKIIDDAIQMHGGAGVSNDVPLTAMYAYMRILRLADGPDEVHRGLIAKLELKKYV